MARILIVEDHRFFSEAPELLLGGRLSDEGADPAEFRRSETVAGASRSPRGRPPSTWPSWA